MEDHSVDGLVPPCGFKKWKLSSAYLNECYLAWKVGEVIVLFSVGDLLFSVGMDMLYVALVGMCTLGVDLVVLDHGML